MPRNTAIKRSFDTPKVDVPATVPPVNKPSLGNILAESMTSGVGFGLGSALVRRMFAPTSAVNNEYEQCLEQNTEASACYNLSNQYKACMIRTNFNQNQCTELYS
jgi:Rod binding domain-containing protein